MNNPKSGITFLKTQDLDRTTDFYINIVGFDLALDQGSCRIFRICRNCFIGFCLTDGTTGSDEVIITIEIDDVDGYCQHLKSRGAEIEVPPRINTRYNIYQMFIRDPNGYRIEIQRFLDPNWSGTST